MAQLMINPKKSMKVPKKDMDLVLKRMKEVKHG